MPQSLRVATRAQRKGKNIDGSGSPPPPYLTDSGIAVDTARDSSTSLFCIFPWHSRISYIILYM